MILWPYHSSQLCWRSQEKWYNLPFSKDSPNTRKYKTWFTPTSWNTARTCKKITTELLPPLFDTIDYMYLQEREMFYLTTYSTHFIYGYMSSDIWLRTILIVRKETRCCHIGYSYRLTARVLLYAPSHRQDNTYHGLCYTSFGALAGTRPNYETLKKNIEICHHVTTVSNFVHAKTYFTPINLRRDVWFMIFFKTTNFLSWKHTCNTV